MAHMGRPGLSAAQKADLWQRWKQGQSLSEIGRALGKHAGSIHGVLSSNAGVVPPVRTWSRWASLVHWRLLVSVSVRPVRLKSAPKSTEIFYGKSLLDRALQPMMFNTMSLPAYRDSFISSLSNGMRGGEFSAIVMSPLVGIMGLCLISLLVLGGLWLKSRFLDSGLHRARYTETLPEPSSTYDYVTGLPTRRLFGTLLEQAVGRAAKTGRSLAVLVVELEHFRMVAETQGRANGNVLVRVQAARVKGVVRSTETVARLAQDQFALILDSFTSHEEVVAIVDKLQATIGLPLTLEGQELFLTCHIGVALYPQDAMKHEELIEQAKQAGKRAKSDGQAVQFTSPIIPSAASESVARVSVQTEQEARHS